MHRGQQQQHLQAQKIQISKDFCNHPSKQHHLHQRRLLLQRLSSQALAQAKDRQELLLLALKKDLVVECQESLCSLRKK